MIVTGECDSPYCHSTKPLQQVGKPGDDNYGGNMIGQCPDCGCVQWVQNWAGGRKVLVEQ